MRSPSSASTLDVLSQAATELRAEFEHVADRAFYLWPETDPSDCRGFSYTIPKEEQIRSHLHHALRAADRNAAVELEWNFYRSTGGKHARVTIAGEIDIVRFGKTVDLFEVKRIWNITGWNNKRGELLGGIEADRTKLADVRTALATAGRTPGDVGVIVASFSDRTDGHTGMDAAWSAAELGAPHPTPDFTAHDESKPLYVRFYFLPVVDQRSRIVAMGSPT